MTEHEPSGRKTTGPPTVTLLTDFGLSDEYAAVLKGVILGYRRDIRLVDISHQVPPQDILAASHLLSRTYPFFPEKTVHLVVVDPGVGTKRDILAIAADGQLFVGPDNGVFSGVLEQAEKLSIHRVTATTLFRPRVSKTFHGRDIMAPVAAQLACGLPIDRVGPAIDPKSCHRTELPPCTVSAGHLHGVISHSDRFGNLCTNIRREDLETFADSRDILVRLENDEDVFFDSISTSYGAREPNSLLLLYDSHDHLEIAVNMGNASDRLGSTIGSRVTVTLRET